MNLAKKGTEDAVVLLSRKDFINLHNVERLGIGCDLTAQKDGVEYKIEVKATRTKGIPDAFENEFEFDNLGKRPRLKADYLMVVWYNKKDGKDGPQPIGATLLTKDVVDRYADRHIDSEGRAVNEHKVVKHVKFSLELQKGAWNKQEGEWLDWTEE